MEFSRDEGSQFYGGQLCRGRTVGYTRLNQLLQDVVSSRPQCDYALWWGRIG